MKIREGFVSNSSSTAFILDIRKKGVKEFLKKVKAPRMDLSYGRCTGIAYGEEVVELADNMDDDCHEEWIKHWIIKLGKKNIVYLRESDEMTGIFGDEPTEKHRADYDKLDMLASDDQEYH